MLARFFVIHADTPLVLFGDDSLVVMVVVHPPNLLHTMGCPDLVSRTPSIDEHMRCIVSLPVQPPRTVKCDNTNTNDNNNNDDNKSNDNNDNNRNNIYSL
jgi:hypothetical protein